MNREYTVSEFRRVADFLLARVPGLTLATDIICGFPGETEEHFEETLALIRDYRFPVLNISQFYPRPGTPAAKMKRINTKIVKGRSRRCTALFLSYEPHGWLLGDGGGGAEEEKGGVVAAVATAAAAAAAAAAAVAASKPSPSSSSSSPSPSRSSAAIPVFVCTEKSSDGSNSVGHTKGYVKVLLPRDDSLIGCEVLARVTSAHKFHVTAEVVSVVRRPGFDLAAVLRGSERSRINGTATGKDGNALDTAASAKAAAVTAAATASTPTVAAAAATCSNPNGCCGGGGGDSCSTRTKTGTVKAKRKRRVSSKVAREPIKRRPRDKPAERWIFLALPLIALVLVPLLNLAIQRVQASSLSA